MFPARDYGQDHHIVGNDQETFEEEEESRPDRGKEILDEAMVDAGGIPGVTKADFVEAGFSCTECVWTTRKKGINGVQALRAHSKRHVRDRRATRNSHALHAIVFAIGLLIGVSPDLVLESLSTTWLSFYPLQIPISIDTFGKSIATVSVTLTMTILFVSSRYVTTGRRKWSGRYKWAEALWVIFFIFVAAMMWTDVGRNIELYWMISALLPWIASVLVRVSVVKTRITVVRREFNPRRGIKLLRAKEYRTDLKINRLIRYLKQQIQDGRIVPSSLRRETAEYFRRLGLGVVQLDLKLERKRLSREHRERQVKERERAMRKRQWERDRNSRLVKRSRESDQILRTLE